MKDVLTEDDYEALKQLRDGKPTDVKLKCDKCNAFTSGLLYCFVCFEFRKEK